MLLLEALSRQSADLRLLSFEGYFPRMFNGNSILGFLQHRWDCSYCAEEADLWFCVLLGGGPAPSREVTD